MTQKRHGDSTLLIDILTRNVSATSGSKVMVQIVVFVFSVTLTFDLCSIFWSHALRMMYWNIHATFHKNPSSMNGRYAAVKVLNNALCFIMGYLVAMEIRVTLFLLVQFCICYIV